MAEKKQTDNDINRIPIPVVIIFAEYLGFVSDLLDWADKWCNEEGTSEWKKKIMTIDAANLMREIRKHYTEEDLNEWYEAIYEDYLKSYVESYNKHNNKEE